MALNWAWAQRCEGLSVMSLAVTPPQCGSLALAATTEGLYISRDDGQSWSRAPGAFGTLPLLAVCVSPSYESDRLVFVGTQGGILYSHDLAGWTSAHLPSQEIAITLLAAAPNFADEGVLLAGTLRHGMLRSDDCGCTWRARNFGLLDLEVLAVAISPDFASDQTALVGTATGIFYTPNGGRAWREGILPRESGPILALAFSSSYPDDRLILATTEKGVILRSVDAGRAWSSMETPCAGCALNAVAFSPHSPGRFIVMGSDSKVYLSADGGSNWETWETTASVLSLISGIGQNGHPFILAGLEDGIARGR